MLKLLLVDDEPIIRAGLKDIIPWEKYGYEICGEAEDGPSALNAILTLKPDLVLLDLQLPGFSGLEVIRKVREKGGAVRFLVVSGYAEFEYAQEAINLDAGGYIVKPIEETTLIERITSIANEIKKEDPEEQKYIEFLEIMEGKNRRGSDRPLFTRGEPEGTQLFSCEYIQAALILEGNRVSGQTGLGLRKIRNFFTENTCHVFAYREYVVLLFEDTPETVVRRLLEKLYDHLEKTGSRAALTLGCRCRNVEDGSAIFTSCRDAEELMGSVFFFRDKKFLSGGEMPERKANGPDRDIAEEAPELCSYIQIIDHKKILDYFRNLEEYFFCSGKNPREIRQECMALFIETRNILLNKIPQLKEMTGTGRETLSSVMKLDYLGDIMDTMAEASIQISDCLPLLSADSSFQRIISYVKNNFREDLRLESLGRLFNYNCAYLGKRFKEYTGKHFHTYLDILRIDAAKELLRNTDMKVYEISAAVGYANTDYFYSKFRKHAGESPLIFRRNRIKP